MNKRLSFVASVFLASFALGIAGAGVAYANDDDDVGDDGEFRWMACTGMHELGFLGLSGVGCPDAAMAKNGDIMEIVGEGTLEIDDEDGDVSGGGSYRHTDATGGVKDVGTFTATNLKSFESFGGSSVTPPSWRLGRALIRIRMVSDFDGKETKATLLVGCILPSPIEGPPPSDLIEGIRLKVKKGQNFDMPPPTINEMFPGQRATLIIRLDGDDGDEKDDDD